MSAMKQRILVIVAITVLAGIACLLYAGRIIQRGFSTRSAPSSVESSLAMTMRGMAIPAYYY